ncbi:MAG: 2-C-methyl-D-erythritol 4-phosphate cytidylyltransferase [Pseudomonadota bacterium]|jgi:2-C-methyl-D-erythritol 4-phosphate cytidylyltransferase|nr:2-C-methyl-D-erythritol 4-phosphate cytidylyltransferase [Pseudomonadota bacterium]
MRYWLVMPAAGIGRRFGSERPKQYAPLCGRAVIQWALAPFLADERCAGAMVALAAHDPYWSEVAPPGVMTVAGGAERSHSVRQALAALAARAAPEDWVLVHDAARPCLAPEDLERLLGELAEHPLGGLLAAPAADTLKRADAHGCVAATVDRTGLWRALTPQMFRYGALCRALDAAHAASRVPTDEAQALEWAGERPVLVAGSAGNLKITTAADLTLAAAFLEASA